MIFNSLTTSLVEVTTNNIGLLKLPSFDYNSLPHGPRKFVDQLKEGGFVVEDATDELKTLEFVVNTIKYDRTGLDLTIAPTLRCNFTCTYCYEQSAGSRARRDGHHAVMPQPVRENLLKLIERRASTVKRISVTWFGGEPLLAKDVVFDLSAKIIRIADRKGIEYGAGMLTNGYLLNRDPDIVRKLKESRISFFQITIDGPPDVHNVRRRLKGSKGPTFGPILEGIKLLAENDLRVDIRINVDRTNKDEALQTLDIFEANGIRNVSFHFGHVAAETAGCRSIAESCTTMPEFSMMNQALERRLSRGGFRPAPYLHYPKSAHNICAPNRLAPIIVDPDGDLYKCLNDIGDKTARIGNVADFESRSEEEIAREIRWVTWEALDYPDCRACKFLPICLGGCPYGPVVHGEKPECVEWKYGLEYYVRARYASEKAEAGSITAGVGTDCRAQQTADLTPARVAGEDV